jgi:hypothetical protein
VDDFIARNGLDFGKGDEDAEKDPDAKIRTKRAEEGGEPSVNDLSWLLEQDAWEKVDDAELDWENIGKEEFDAGEGALPRETRAADRIRNVREVGQSISEDAINQKLRQLTEDLKRIRGEIDAQREDGEGVIQDSVKDYRLEDGANNVEDDYMDSSMWRRRKRSSDNEVTEIEGRIDLMFESKPENPTATVIIQKDTQQPHSPPKVPPPIYFCGTKTDPNNPDSVSGEVSEMVAFP